MPTFTEMLYDTAASKHNGITWEPAEDRPGSGRLTIEMGQGRGGGKRSCVVYAVAEFATSWDGRAFRFAKLTEGTDTTSDAEDVFVGSNGQDRTCSCKGFSYGRGRDKEGRSSCKHVEAAIALLLNRWI